MNYEETPEEIEAGLSMSNKRARAAVPPKGWRYESDLAIARKIIKAIRSVEDLSIEEPYRAVRLENLRKELSGITGLSRREIDWY